MEFIRAVGRDLYAGDSKILLRGFGLGGWFLPEGYMWKWYNKCDRPRRFETLIEKLCGMDYAETFWSKYLDSYITEQDLNWIAKEGFNSVRLPLNSRHLYDVKDGILTLNCRTIQKIDELIDWCRKLHIYVILDMHGAPGGQTGQNIDDSENDLPLLYIEKHYEEELVWLWRELANRYRDEPVIAGYDLLNEPLPNFFNQYNDKALPLYRRLIQEIRKIDQNHMIILEGLHWATDFSIFNDFTKEEATDNIMLQFHKYWNNPDVESIIPFMKWAEDLSVPLFMGEGGENNCDWYTTAFPMFEQYNISWSFWSYKKMECLNSPVTFTIPEGWDEIINYITGDTELSSERAVEIFDRFLYHIQHPRYNEMVIHSLKREAPVSIPCEAYNDYHVISSRLPGAELRMTEPVSILFENGKTGKVDYRGHGGKEQPDEENLLVQLSVGDSVGYLFCHEKDKLMVTILAEGQGELNISLNSEVEHVSIMGKDVYLVKLKCEANLKQRLWIACTNGSVRIDRLNLA